MLGQTVIGYLNKEKARKPGRCASGGANAMKYRRFENHDIFWHTICTGFRPSEGGIEEEDDFFGMVKKIDSKNLGFQNADSSWVSARRSQPVRCGLRPHPPRLRPSGQDNRVFIGLR